MPRSKVFEKPDELYEYFELYKQDIVDNPIIFNAWTNKKGVAHVEKRHRPMTWAGFEAFLYKKGLLVNLDQYRTAKGSYASFSSIIRVIGKEMFDNKFSGAAVGIYQQNIIARELGLAEKAEVQNFQRPILEGGKELPDEENTLTDDELLGSEED